MILRSALASIPLLPCIAFGMPACSATSGAQPPAVVELYTSEGCDSCPPADRWMSSLKTAAAQGKVLPLAFHVDSWDYLGWKDRFSDAAYSARHRAAASAAGARVVYTPQVLLDGREFQAWRRTPAEQLAAAARAKAGAQLQVYAQPAPSGVRVSVDAKSAAKDAQAFVALFENGLATDVKAGENRGVTLHHDFVVRRWLGPFAFENGRARIDDVVAPPAGTSLAASGIAVVAVDGRGRPLAAVAVPLHDCGGG
jgi:hypothetical protein